MVIRENNGEPAELVINWGTQGRTSTSNFQVKMVVLQDRYLRVVHDDGDLGFINLDFVGHFYIAEKK